MGKGRSKIAVTDRDRLIKQVSSVGVFGNVLLTGFKLFAGIYGRSGAMVSDAVHSLSDVFATFIAYVGVKLAGKSPDREHPYGHERFECVASLLVGIMLFAAGVAIGKTGVQNIISGDYASLAMPGTIALVAAIVSIVTKEAMYHYTRHCAVLLDSSAFMADAWHHRSDAFSSIGSLIGIGGAMMGYKVLDCVASLVICVFILKVAFDIVKSAMSNMMDTAWSEDRCKALADFACAQEGVIRVDSLRSRMFGSNAYIDLEVCMDGNKTLRETHELAERLHDMAEKEFPDIKHIMIHVNPDD